MGSNAIIFFIFIAILLFIMSEGIAIYIVKEKGKKLWYGILLGFLPFLGQAIAGFLKETDEKLVASLYDRDLITKDEYSTMTTDINLKDSK